MKAKNLLISCLAAWLMHETNFVVECTTAEYWFVLFCLSACLFVFLEYIDTLIRQSRRVRRRRETRRIRRSIDFSQTLLQDIKKAE